MKKINIKETETIQLELSDGVIKECRFDAYSMYILDEEYEEDGGFIGISSKAEKTPFVNGAKLLYGGMKSCDENVTFLDAKRMVAKMNLENLMEIFKCVRKATNMSNTEKKSKVTPQDHKK